MGDLRNKFAKQERDARVRAMQRRLYPETPPASPLACGGCGKTVYETEIYSLPRGHFDPPRFSCVDCMDPEIRKGAGL